MLERKGDQKGETKNWRAFCAVSGLNVNRAVDKRPEKDPKTKMAGTSPLLGVESAHAVGKRAEKDPPQKNASTPPSFKSRK